MGYLKEETDPKSNQLAFRFIKEFTLTPDAQKLYDHKLKQVIEWMVGLWRTLYNVRSLDTPIPEEYPEKQFLEQVVSRAATQGFSNAYNIMENLADYFNHVIENNMKCP